MHIRYAIQQFLGYLRTLRRQCCRHCRSCRVVWAFIIGTGTSIRAVDAARALVYLFIVVSVALDTAGRVARRTARQATDEISRDASVALDKILIFARYRATAESRFTTRATLRAQ